MNMLEHYIEEVHHVKDVTKQYEKSTGDTPKDPVLEVDVTYNCYGAVERSTRHFYKTEWEEAEKNGYFMG